MLGDTLSVLLAGDRVGKDDLIDKLAHGPLEPSMALLVIRVREAGREPGWLPIGDLGKGVRFERLDLWPLALDSANLQALVLRAVKHLLPVQAEERLGSVFPRCFTSLL